MWPVTGQKQKTGTVMPVMQASRTAVILALSLSLGAAVLFFSVCISTLAESQLSQLPQTCSGLLLYKVPFAGFLYALVHADLMQYAVCCLYRRCLLQTTCCQI